MAYQNNIPQPTHRKSKSQGDILGNFAALNSWGNGYGEFTTQTVVPSFPVGDDGLYTKLFSTTNTKELFVHKQVLVGTKEIPLTSSILSTTTPASSLNGWTYLPSGIILRWQSITGNGLTTATLSGATTPAFTQIFTILVSPFSSTTGDDNFAVRLVSIDSGTQFKVYFSSRNGSGAAAGGAKVLIIGV